MNDLITFRSLAVLLIPALFGTACALYKPGLGTAPLVTTCNIPGDQSGTVSGHWTTTPIPVAFHTGDFTPAEVGSMSAAVTSWNTFFTASKNVTVLEDGTAGGGGARSSTAADTAPAGTLCS